VDPFWTAFSLAELREKVEENFLKKLDDVFVVLSGTGLDTSLVARLISQLDELKVIGPFVTSELIDWDERRRGGGGMKGTSRRGRVGFSSTIDADAGAGRASMAGRLFVGVVTLGITSLLVRCAVWIGGKS
jgi:hypothetical protein